MKKLNTQSDGNIRKRDSVRPDGYIGEKLLAELRLAFERRCIYLLIQGYKRMTHTHEYDTVAWKETQFTANLIKHISDLPVCREWQVSVIPEYPLYNKDIQIGEKLPEEAPRIDIRLDSWQQKYLFIYGIEAKIVVATNFSRPDGIINASQKRRRYIDTGIDNFVSKRYPKGCLTGYVLQGDVGSIVESLNRLLTRQRKRASEVLNHVTIIMSEDYPHCYHSRHEQAGLTLNHIFLPF